MTNVYYRSSTDICKLQSDSDSGPYPPPELSSMREITDHPATQKLATHPFKNVFFSVFFFKNYFLWPLTQDSIRECESAIILGWKFLNKPKFLIGQFLSLECYISSCKHLNLGTVKKKIRQLSRIEKAGKSRLWMRKCTWMFLRSLWSVTLLVLNSGREEELASLKNMFPQIETTTLCKYYMVLVSFIFLFRSNSWKHELQKRMT